MSNFIRDVAESAPIREVVERYTDQGIKRNTFLCPFHDDTHPSASFKRDNRWTCYVCNASGDSVDFVAKLFGLRPIDAAKKLNDDFGLGIADEKNPWTQYASQRRKKQNGHVEKPHCKKKTKNCRVDTGRISMRSIISPHKLRLTWTISILVMLKP